MNAEITNEERAALHRMRTLADELARTIKEVSEMGLQVQFNMNVQIGACDMFNVSKMVPVDMRAGAN